MMRARLTLGLVSVLLLWALPAVGQDKPKNEGPVVHGFIRPDWLIQKVDDPFRDDLRVFHFLSRTRLYLKGTYEGVRYRVEVGLSGPEAEIPVSRTVSGVCRNFCRTSMRTCPSRALRTSMCVWDSLRCPLEPKG